MAKATFRQQARENPIGFPLMMVLLYVASVGYEFLRRGRAHALARRAPREWAWRMTLRMLLIVPLETWLRPRIALYLPVAEELEAELGRAPTPQELWSRTERKMADRT